ncbi:CDP-alcohol phosphatidyltransferase [Subtercola boreus]|uniref:CDP-alcohol phosphatidyltransferase n=1 Tax=Subtercola boreus TaxID=120213 RepID=A0A3E0VX65_9MICO|nr:CDP-alcohol phosphatidyltransferase family protein [Subtercola boreus]RFA14652.1 CDP-alcohol phosphatidyltransferase [Subtercola boreus]
MSVASKETYRQTVSRLASAQKKAAPGAPAYSIYVNRRIGRYLAAWAFRAGLTPNGVSGISAAFTFSGIVLLAVLPVSWISGIAVALLLAIGYAFDSADGQVARLRGGGSLSGEWLDHVVDSVKIASLHLAVLITLFLHVDLTTPWLLLIPIVYSVVACVSFFAMILNDQLKRGRTGPVAPRGRASLLRSLLVVPTDYGILCLVFALLGSPVLFIALYGLMAVANAGHLVLASRKWFCDMTELDASLSARPETVAA